MYNSIFAFSSLSADVQDDDGGGRAPYSFRIQGAVYHKLGSIIPADDNVANAQFAQLYIYDARAASQRRMSLMDGLDLETVETIEAAVRLLNPYSAIYRTAAEQWRAQPGTNLSLVLRADPDQLDMRRYNAPTDSNELMAIISDFESPNAHFNVAVSAINAGDDVRLTFMNECSPHYEPTRFPLIFLSGDLGWTPSLRCAGFDGVTRSVSLQDHCSYRWMVRFFLSFVDLFD